MIINISELLSTTAKSESYSIPIEMEHIQINGRTYEITHKAPAALTITNTGERKISIEGHMDVVVDIPCDRCLSPVPTKFSLDMKREIDMNQSDEDRIRDLDETCYMSHSSLDVDLLVYNEILLHFPMKILCKDDCRGICPKCGQNLNEGECGCDRESLDPRMSAIRDIFNKFKEV